jgi:protein tyrosine phosphatase (PTP) superfamily phosphohydrolase (DUF442 family)
VVSVGEPFAVAGIRNFGWVEPGVVARGEQPPLVESTFQGLYALGIRSVLSLRPDGEPPTSLNPAAWPEYHLEDERQHAQRAGLAVWHAPMADFSAPRADEIAAALAALDQAVASRPGVYVHCRAGAGRTAVVTGAWLVARGGTGDDAAALYQRFTAFHDAQVDIPPDQFPARVRRLGRPFVWWSLREIAAALGSPVVGSYALPDPEQPPGAEAWPDAYRAALRPWRERRVRVEPACSRGCGP